MMRAAWTLPPTRSGPVSFGFGGGGAPPMPPMTPPSTPPMEPPATPPGTPPLMPADMSGSASSLMILTSLGMTFGAINLPASIKWACGLTWTTCAIAGGGGGGGGGGGAVSMVAIMALGSASVEINGIRIIIKRKRHWNSIEPKTVQGLVVFLGFGLEITISSNMGPTSSREQDVRGRFRYRGFCCRLRVRCLPRRPVRASDSRRRRAEQRYQN